MIAIDYTCNVEITSEVVNTAFCILWMECVVDILSLVCEVNLLQDCGRFLIYFSF